MAFTTGNDVNILQTSDNAIVGAGAGNDKYILSAANVTANQQITLSDTLGTNTLQLMGGLTIASSQVAADTVMLTLSNGAVVTVNGASTFSYEIAGDPLSGVAGTVQTFSAFVTTTLGAASVPTGSTVVTGTPNKVIAGGTSAVTPLTFALTANNDTPAMTSGNDTVTGAAGTLAATDVISDASTTDSDTLTAIVTVATLAPVISKVENVNINGQFTTTGLDLATVTGTKVATFNTAIVSGTATVGTAVAGAGVRLGSTEKIVFGSNVSTATINSDSASTGTAGAVNVDAGSVTALTMTGASSADNYAITTNGNITFTGSNLVETMKLTATVADKWISLDGAAVAGNTTDIASAVATTIKGILTGKTITKSGAGVLTADVNAAGAADLSKVAADKIVLTAPMNNTLTVKAGADISTAINQTALTITGPAATATTNSVTLTNTAATQTSLTTTSVKTLNLVSNATQVAGVDATYSTLNAGTDNVVLTGTNDVTVATGTAKSFDASALVGSLVYSQAATAATTVKGGSGANTIVLANAAVDATYVGKDAGDTVTAVNTTGATTITTGAGADTINATGAIAGAGALSLDLGAGNDTVNATALTTGVISGSLGAGDDTVVLGVGVTGTAVVAIDGGAGTDVVKFGAGSDIKAGTLSLTNVETISLGAVAGTMTFSAAQLSGTTFNIQGTATAATDILAVTGIASTTAIDLSGLVMDQTITKGISKTTISAALSSAAVTIKGTAVADTITAGTAGSTITAGAGADTITVGAGTDKVVYSAATGAALKTESAGLVGTSATTVPAYVAGTTGDTIAAGFTIGTDKIVLSLALGTAGASTGLVASGGTSYTTASTALAAEDFLTTTLAGASTAITANTAGGGRFIFDTTGSFLIYDASGNSAISALGVYTAGADDDFIVVKTTGVNLLATDFIFA